MRIARYLAAAVLVLLAVSGWASERRFPAKAKRATMVFVQGREVTINGEPRRLSSGNHIWNEKNRLDRPTNLVGAQLAVNYTEDRYGNIDRVWILTEKEIAENPEQQSIAPIDIQMK